MTDDDRPTWLRHAADVAETLTHEEILSLGLRLRAPTAEWLRQAAATYEPGEKNIHPPTWVGRLLLEERGYTLASNPKMQLGPRNQSD